VLRRRKLVDAKLPKLSSHARAAYPDLERDDVHEALRYAADAVRERALPLTAPHPTG
jgi:hypothetical protein